MNLFLDTCSDYLFLMLFDDEKNILMSKSVYEPKQHTDLAVDNIKKAFKLSNYKFEDIKKIYITNGPGYFVGVRVTLTIAKAWKSIKSDLKIFVSNSFDIQNIEVNFIKANAYEVYTRNNKIKKIEKIDEESLGYVDTKNIFKNFFSNIENFKNINNLSELETNFIKGFC